MEINTENVATAEPVALDEVSPEQEKDRHEIIEPVSNNVPYSSDAKDSGILNPTGVYSAIVRFMELVDVISPEDFKEKYTPKEVAVTGLNVNSLKSTLKDDMYVTSDEMVNSVKYADKDLTIRPLPLRSNTDTKVTGQVALAQFTSFLGIGEVVQVPLWHSGIWVSIKPPKDNEIIALENAIASYQIELGRETNTLIYSNYAVVFNKLVTDFIMDHIVAHTIKLEAGDDLRNHILVQDLNPLILGLITSMFPDGYNITRACVKSLELTEDKTPLCDAIVTGKCDPKKLYWLNRKSLSKDMLHHMSKRNPNSATADEIAEYKLSISNLLDKKVTLKAGNGKDVTFTFGSPTLPDYIDNGELWVQNVIAKTEEIFTDNDNMELRNTKITTVLSSVILGIYNIYVKELEMGSKIVSDRKTIDDALDLISSDGELIDPFFNEIKKYIANNSIAIIATPNYRCTSCATVQQQDDNNNQFNNLLPLNVLENFFDLSGLRILKIKGRNNIS